MAMSLMIPVSASCNYAIHKNFIAPYSVYKQQEPPLHTPFKINTLHLHSELSKKFYISVVIALEKKICLTLIAIFVFILKGMNAIAIYNFFMVNEELSFST